MKLIFYIFIYTDQIAPNQIAANQLHIANINLINALNHQYRHNIKSTSTAATTTAISTTQTLCSVKCINMFFTFAPWFFIICIDIYGTYNTHHYQIIMDIIQHKNIIINNENPMQHNHKQYDHIHIIHIQQSLIQIQPKKRPPTHDIAYNTNTCLLWTYN